MSVTYHDCVSLQIIPMARESVPDVYLLADLRSIRGMKEKVICEECGWQGEGKDVLRAPNPFDPEEQMSGCPYCHSVESLVRACDGPGCWEPAAYATPVANDYRYTCFRHRPMH